MSGPTRVQLNTGHSRRASEPITTPIIIGYIVQGTKSFNGALVFVAVNALAAIVCYLLVVGDISRVELKTLE